MRICDQIEKPKADGYRAMHVIVRRRECRIEVQLRTQTQHFLLVFDHDRAQLLRCDDFDTAVKHAMAEYARLESEHMDTADGIEIVLIGSDSLDTVKVTPPEGTGGSSSL